MIPLAPRLDDIDFDGLLALARERLPGLAPDWTDYNYHDPGIMLIELLAWIADTQIYSLARDRTDERLAMARLFGIRPRGAVPARGVVYPAEPPTGVRAIPAGSVLKPARDAVPRLETVAEITMLPIGIARIATHWPGRPSLDHTAVNARARASFPPFGEDGDGELRIELTTQDGVESPVLLSLGFEVGGAGPATPPHRFGRVDVLGADGRPLRRRRDTTCGLQRSGVMIFALDPTDLAAPIVLRPGAGYALTPRLTLVAPNALPVAQRATLQVEGMGGTGRPGQTIEIAPADLFPADEIAEGRAWRLCDGSGALRLSVAEQQVMRRWSPGRLDRAGPESRCFAVQERADGSRIRLRFGNGINGRKPGAGQAIAVSIRLGCGLGGNMRRSIDWLLDGGRTRWRNAGPIEGGRDAQDATGALGEARARLRDNRLLATSEQIADAVRALGPALGLARAEVEEGWERGRKAPAIAATRTLILGRERPETETAAWLRAVAETVRPRVAIGERLLVVKPVYRPFGVGVKAKAAVGRDPEAIAASIKAMLAERLAPRRLPLGRDIAATAIAGWVRRVDGVDEVGDVALRIDGRDWARLKVGQGEQARFIGPAAVTVEAGQ